MSFREKMAAYVATYVAAERQKLQQAAIRQHLVSSFRFLQQANDVVIRQSATMREGVLFKLTQSYIESFFIVLAMEPAFAGITALEIGDDLFLTPQKIITSQDPEYQTLQQEQILTIAKVEQLLQ